jgi:acyl-CoA thioesterase-1
MIERRALFFGDSHVAGVGDPTGVGWPGRVAAAAHLDGNPITAYNLGVRGQTSHDVLRGWAEEAQPRLHTEADCRAVVSFGVNDAVQFGRAATRRAPKLLGHLLDEMAAARLAVFVVGPAPILDHDHHAHLEEISRRFAPICEERRVPFAPVFELLSESELWRDELASGDGAHPGAAGYELHAELVIERGLLDWLLAPMEEPQGLPHRRFAPSRPYRSPGIRPSPDGATRARRP